MVRINKDRGDELAFNSILHMFWEEKECYLLDHNIPHALSDY